MVFAVDFEDGDALQWATTPDGATVTRDPDYAPTLYVAAPGTDDLRDVEPDLQYRPDVVGTAVEERRRGFRHDPEPVLRVDVTDPDAVTPVAHYVRARDRPLECQCFNVDLAREFRYCLERGITPTPGRPLRTLDLDVPRSQLSDPPITGASVAGEAVTGDEADVLESVGATLAERDPDVLVVDTARVVPALFEAAERRDVAFRLGRADGWERLAGASTFESYGDVRHSPARYSVPGRVLIDRSNTFMYHETNLEGCLDLVERSGKPLQELAWASIGNVLTCIQIREAHDRGVLVPWKSRRHERFKSMATLHEADRGGHVVAPRVGVHEDVHELDFASLYPNVIRTRNLSPETVRCDCHDRDDVPGLGYSVCDERGYLPEVLGPLIDDRAAIKRELESVDDPDRRAELEGRSSAIKWILVSCFGYQGFSNAKFGRIECHEAINAHAREILLDAKETLEAGGWRVVHGIVDSLWVTAADADPTPLADLRAAVTDRAGIELEYEAAYDWLAFVPQRDSAAGALTKYFGVRTDGSRKYRGIECRQRSTPPFVADVQERLVSVLDDYRSPEPVCDAVAAAVADLEAGAVDPADLAITKRASKAAADYDRFTRTVAALERAADRDRPTRAGQDVRYVVVDDDADSRERVRLAGEDPGDYDAGFYRDRLLRAAESVVSPLGWDRADVEAHLDDTDERTLAAYVPVGE